MKILHVVPYFAPAWAYGGPPKAVFEIAKKQLADGHEVSVLTTVAFEKNETLASGSSVIENITVTRLPNTSNWLMWKFHFSTPIGVRSYFRHNHFDVIHLHEVRTLLNLFALLFGKANKYFLSPWGTLPYNSSQLFIKKILDLLIMPLLNKKITASFAQTEHESEVLKTFLPQTKPNVIPLGIDLTEFEKLPTKLQARKKLDLEPSAFYFLYLGRFSPHKGLGKLIQVFAELHTEHKHTRLILVGRDDGYLSEIKQLIQSNSLQDTVQLRDPLYGAERLFAYVAADAFVFMPTVYEETGTVCLEALASKLPVITSTEAAIPGMAKADGVICIPNTNSELLKSMQQMLHTTATVNSKRVESLFGWQSISTQMSQAYA